jgi:hypothetical protein
MKFYTKPYQQAIPEPPVVPAPPPPEVKGSSFLCIECDKAAQFLYAGASFCGNCLKEKRRRGII